MAQPRSQPARAPQLHLVITTREDPQLPLARLRARGQLTELRAADLRFTRAEAGAFLEEVMGLSLSAPDITALETAPKAGLPAASNAVSPRIVRAAATRLKVLDTEVMRFIGVERL